MADLPPLGTTAILVQADSEELDRAFEQEIPRKARAGAERAGQTFGSEMAKSLSSSIQARQAEIKNALDKGLISQEQARDLAKRAARGFTTEFNRNIRELGRQGQQIDIVDEARLRSEIRRLSSLIPRELGAVGRRGGRELSENLRGGLTGGLSGLKGVLAGTIVGAVAAGGVQALQAAARFARRIGETIRAGIDRGSQVLQRRQAFGALAAARGLDQDEVLRTLRSETRLLVADFDLLRQANFALQAGLPATAHDLGNLANIARRLARAVGIDATDAYDRLINSIAKGERRVLDELGIIVSFTDAYDEFAKSLGKSSDQLTTQEQIQARLNAVLEAGQTRVRDLGEESLTAGERLRQMETVLGDIRDRTLELLVESPRVTGIFERLGIAAETTAEQIDQVAASLVALLETSANLATDLPRLFGAAALAGPAAVLDIIPGIDASALRGVANLFNLTEDFERRRAEILERIRSRQAELAAENRREVEGTKKEARETVDILKELEVRLRLIRKIEAREPVIDLRTQAQRRAQSLKAVVDELFPEIQRRIDRQVELGAPDAVKLRQFRAEVEEVVISGDEVGQKMLALNGIFAKFGLTAEDLPPFLRAIVAEILGIDDAADGAAEGTSALAETLDQVGRGARGLLRVADAAGILSDDIRNALEGAIELSAAIADVAEHDDLSFGTLVQGLGGILSLGAGVAGLFSDTERTRQRDELVQSLDRLRQAIDTWAEALLRVPGQVALEVAGIFQTATFQPSSTVQGVTRGGRDLELIRDPAEIVRRLRARGVTGADIRRLGERLDGLDLGDLARAVDGLGRAGKRTADEIQALEKAIDLDIIRQFFETFRAQLDLLQREVDILDLSPEEELDRTRKLFKDFGTGIGDDLAGLDLTTEEGRAEAERIIEEAFKAGITDPATLLALAGKNLSAEEFLDLLGRFETLLDEQTTEAELQSTSQGGVFRGVSIGQGDALIALGQTQVAHLQDIAISARTLAGRPLDSALLRPLGIGQPTGAPSGVTSRAPTPPAIPTDVGRLATPAPSFSVAVTVGSVGPFQVTGANGESVVREAVGLSGRRLAQLIESETRQRLENRGVT